MLCDDRFLDFDFQGRKTLRCGTSAEELLAGLLRRNIGSYAHQWIVLATGKMKVNGLTTTKISERLSVLLTLDFGRSGRDTPTSGSWSIRDDRDLHNSMPQKSSLSLHRDGLSGGL